MDYFGASKGLWISTKAGGGKERQRRPNGYEPKGATESLGFNAFIIPVVCQRKVLKINEDGTFDLACAWNAESSTAHCSSLLKRILGVALPAYSAYRSVIQEFCQIRFRTHVNSQRSTPGTFATRRSSNLLLMDHDEPFSLVSTSFLLLLVRHLFLVAWHLFLVASCFCSSNTHAFSSLCLANGQTADPWTDRFFAHRTVGGEANHACCQRT